jgi:diphthine synthase
MMASQCAAQMLEIEAERKEGVYSLDSLAIAVARIGANDQKIVCGTLKQLTTTELGPPLHSLVLLGKRAHDLEKEYIEDFAIDKVLLNKIWQKDYGKT